MIPLARLASVLVGAAAPSLPTTAAGQAPRTLDGSAKRVSDAFVRALVVKRDPRGAARFTSSRIEELRKLNAGFVRDGVDTVVGQSRILRGCRSAARDKPSKRGDCVRYHLRGTRRAGGVERVTNGDFKLWLRRETGRWKVWAYDYSALVTVCQDVCK